MLRPARRLGLAFASLLVITLAAGISQFAVRAQTGAGQPSAPPPGQAQTPPQRPPLFRAGSNFVLVDAYPRQDGKLVEGLAASDFDVLEDGKPQKVESFEFVRVPMNTPDQQRRDPRSKEEGDQLVSDPHRRVFVVYLDTYFTSPEDAKGLRVPLDNFLNRAMGPLDLFGVATPTTSADGLVFGQRVETTEEMLAKYWVWARGETPRYTPPETYLETCYIGRTELPSTNRQIVNELVRLWRMDQLFTSLEDVTVHLGDVRDARKNLLFFTDGWDPGPPEQSMNKWLWNQKPPPVTAGANGKIRAEPANPFEPNYSKCDQELMRLTAIDFAKRYRDLPILASHANVAFYPVSRWGSSGMGMAAFDDSKSGLLRRLAEDTGGTSIMGTTEADTDKGLRAIADDLSAYYLLGYYSTNGTFDGRYRKIDVRMKPPRLSVTARKGYAAPTVAELQPRAPIAGPSPVDAALGDLAKLQSAAELFAYGIVAGDPSHEASIVAQLADSQIGDARWIDGGEVQATITGADGAVAATGRGRIEAGARATVIHVTPQGTGPFRVQLRVRGDGGTVTAESALATADNALLGAPLLFRATGGAAARLEPAADFQFARRERLHVEWVVNGSLDQREVRLLDRTGAPLAIAAAVTDRVVDGRTVASADITLAPLAPADYLCEITAARGEIKARRLFAVRITR